MKTTILLLSASCLALTSAAQPAPPTPSAPPPAASQEALRDAVREAIAARAAGTNLTVIKGPVPGSDAAPPAAVPVSPEPAVPAPPLTPASPAAATAPAARAPVIPSATVPPAQPATPAPGAGPTAPPRPLPAALPPTAPPAAVAPAPAAASSPTAAKPAEKVIPAGEINFSNMDLNQFLLYYGELSGRTVLRPTALPAAQIILKTQTDLTPTEAIQAFDSVLAMNSISMVRVGEKFVKAVPATQANQEGAPLQHLGDEPLPELGPYVTHIAQLKYARPSEMIQALMPFAKIQNGILAIDSSQILVLRDYTENVKRMLELIKEIDVAIPAEFVSEVIPIKYAMASDIASALSSLSSGGAVTSSGGTATGAGGRTGTTGRMGTTGASRFGTTGLQGQPGVNPYGASTPGQPGQPGAQPSFQQRMQDIIKRASTTATGDIQVLGPTKIIADERANALLVFASRQDMQTITNIVAKLDVVLPQVLIETIIMDVSLTDNLEFGVSGVQTSREFGNDFTGAGGVNANKFFNFAGSSATNAVGDLLGSGLRYFGKFNDDVYVTVQAMADKGRVTVIQKPRIMTFHAKPASFFIGSTVPYVTSSYYGGYYGGGPSSQYQQLRVGIGLDVTPYINQDGLVVMEINQQMEEIDGFTKIENVGEVPNTASKTLTAQVAVKDRETIILGGFIRTLRSKSDSGVPVLKDLPLLGYLFKQVSRKTERKELVVLLRPTVLQTPELASAETLAEKLRLPGVSLAEGEDKITEAEQIEKVKRYLAGEEKKAKRRTPPPE